MTELPNSTRWQLWIVAFGFFMQSLDTTIVNTALPSMAKSLGESPLHMHMVVVSYVLTVAVMLPASGWLADKIGVRNIFFTAIVLFTLGSLFCAGSGTLNELVMARVLQGVGGAMMVPVGRLTVMKIVPREQYMAAMTFVTLPGQIGPLLGPALFSLHLFRTPTFSLGLFGSFAGRIGSGMLPFMTPVFLQIGLGFSPFHAGLMMIPMVLGSMGMKRIVVQVVNRFGYRRVLVATTLGLSVVTLLFMSTALLGWYYVLPLVLFVQGMVNSTRFSSMNTLTLKDLPDELASSGNSLLSMIMQLSMSIGVTVAGLLLGMFGQQQFTVDSGTSHTVFMYTWLCMALIIALPAVIFARVPNDTHKNVVIARRKRRT
ncbi:MFS transporter [Citrobacter amalonaticus]|uniref:MFS transporter n=1 Tax=Citrobacter amalonaticus TaxID=35703 RepID=UPI00356B0CB5